MNKFNRLINSLMIYTVSLKLLSNSGLSVKFFLFLFFWKWALCQICSHKKIKNKKKKKKKKKRRRRRRNALILIFFFPKMGFRDGVTFSKIHII